MNSESNERKEYLWICSVWRRKSWRTRGEWKRQIKTPENGHETEAFVLAQLVQKSMRVSHKFVALTPITILLYKGIN